MDWMRCHVQQGTRLQWQCCVRWVYCAMAMCTMAMCAAAMRCRCAAVAEDSVRCRMALVIDSVRCRLRCEHCARNMCAMGSMCCSSV